MASTELSFHMEVPLSKDSYRSIAGVIFSQLCEMDKEQRSRGRVPRWHEIKTLAEDLNSLDSRINAAVLSERTLLDELGYLQRDSSTIRLSGYGRLMCSANKGQRNQIDKLTPTPK